MRKYITILAVILLAGDMVASTANAQIMIEQGKVVIKAKAGETIVNTLPIYNLSDTDSLNLRVYWEDFVYVQPFDGTKEFTAVGTTGYSVGSWVNFSPQQFTLKPKDSKTISYSIQVPVDAKGGYYGVLFVEEGTKSSGTVGVGLVTRVGSLFFIETDNSIRKGKVENLKFSGKELSGDFLNLGDVVLIPDATYYILDKEGLVAERGEIKKFYLPPAKTTAFKIPIGEKLATGDFMAVLSFDFREGENLTYEFDFHKDQDGQMRITKSGIDS